MQTDRFSTYRSETTETPAIRNNAWDVFETQRSKGDDGPRQDSPAPDEDDVGTLECFYD